MSGIKEFTERTAFEDLLSLDSCERVLSVINKIITTHYIKYGNVTDYKKLIIKRNALNDHTSYIKYLGDY